MKSYRDYPLSSVSMHDSTDLRRLLRDVIVRHDIRHVVETGTHEGLGSTRFVAESFPPDAEIRSFVTIEAGWKSWRRARRNLRGYSFVTPVWGHTLALRSAIDFVEHDECILHHERYPDVFIDDVDDPVGFYKRELERGLDGTPRDRLDLPGPGTVTGIEARADERVAYLGWTTFGDPPSVLRWSAAGRTPTPCRST